jgi:hypothetical protein
VERKNRVSEQSSAVKLTMPGIGHEKMLPSQDKSAGLPIWTAAGRAPGIPKAFAMLMGQALVRIRSIPGPTDYKPL